MPGCRQVALLRGINVGGRNRLPMATLRSIVEELGCSDVTTYLQSGNVVFGSGSPPGEIAADLRAAIARSTGLDLAVVVRTAEDWTGVVAANPFPEAATDGKSVHVVFLPESAGDAYDHLGETDFVPDRLVVVDREVYLSTPNGLGRSKLAEKLERITAKLGGTARNWNTVLELERLCAEAG